MQSIAKSLQPSNAGRSLPYPNCVTLVSESSERVRALQAYLCDAGVSSKRLASIELEQLTAVDTPAAVVFVDGFPPTESLPILAALHARRPDLPLVFIAGHATRFSLWHAFSSSTLPPLVLRESAPAALVYDAVRIACETSMTEHLDHPLDPAASLRALEGPASEFLSMLTTEGALRDHYFDRLLPMRLRAASDQFWTPLAVVQRAIRWLEELGVRSVVDIGSGVGKFCVTGALTSSCSFIGIEHRASLATVARNLAHVFGVDHRVSFIDSSFGELKTPTADCYYLFNPFEENLFSAQEALDDEVDLDAGRFVRDVRRFHSFVLELPVGAYILVYNGVGGRIPDCLEEVRVERELPAVLRLLRKTARRKR